MGLWLSIIRHQLVVMMDVCSAFWSALTRRLCCSFMRHQVIIPLPLGYLPPDSALAIFLFASGPRGCGAG
jgi:hypothetical protein